MRNQTQLLTYITTRISNLQIFTKRKSAFSNGQLSIISCPRKRGFTFVELLVVLGIFTVMSGVVLSSYRAYDSNALFANASEDVVLALRQAQVYGSGAKGGDVVCGASSFDCSYGVYFSTSSAYKNKLTVFADVNNNHVYDSGVDSIIVGASVAWPSSISVANVLCGGSGCSTGVASVTFKRPNPDAYIAEVAPSDPALPSPYNSVIITLVDTKSGKASEVNVTRTGQISVQ